MSKGNSKVVKVVLGVIFVVTFINILALENIQGKLLKDVKSGEATLVCNIGSGEKTIEPDMVTSFDGDLWVFKNGSASNCYIVKD